MNIISAIETDTFRWKIRSTLEKRKQPRSNTYEEEAMRNLKRDKSIIILPAGKVNATVVMDRMEYNIKSKDVIQKGNYQLLYKDPASTTKRKKIHKKDVLPRSTANSRLSSAYQPAKFLLRLFGPLQWNTDTYIKNSTHFVESKRNTQLEPSDQFLGYDVENLFTKYLFKKRSTSLKGNCKRAICYMKGYHYR